MDGAEMGSGLFSRSMSGLPALVIDDRQVADEAVADAGAGACCSALLASAVQTSVGALTQGSWGLAQRHRMPKKALSTARAAHARSRAHTALEIHSTIRC